MNVEQYARHAANDVHTASRSMPVIPITEVQRRRMAFRLIPTLGFGVAAWIAIAVLISPSDTAPPAVSGPTTSIIESATETTEAVLAEHLTSIEVTGSDLQNVWSASDATIPLRGATDPCCVEAGAPGELLVLDDRRLLSITTDVRVAAEWSDMRATALVWTAAGTVVAGIDEDGSTALRLVGSDGATAWALGLDTDLGENPELAVDSEGVIWLGRRDLLPVEAGFAPVQWTRAATTAGDPVTEAVRSESRPLAGGGSIRLSDTTIALIAPDNTGMSWELPAGFTAVSADPFDAGVVVVAVASDQTLVLSLQPGGPITAATVDGPSDPAMTVPPMIAADGHRLGRLGEGEDGPFLALVELDVLDALPPLSLDDVAWIAGTYQGVVDDVARVIARHPISVGAGGAEWDGTDGIVVVTDIGVAWIRPGGIFEQRLPIEQIVEATSSGDRHIIGGVGLDGTIRWYELESGRQVDEPTDVRTVDGLTFAAQGRVAMIVGPDWSNVERGEGGEPIPPFDLPELLVRGEDGDELLRLPVGSTERPHVMIHDFDGRRLVLSAEALEPAMAPRTVWIVDLECAECTQVVETDGPDSFDLVGTLDAEGPIAEPRLHG